MSDLARLRGLCAGALMLPAALHAAPDIQVPPGFSAEVWIEDVPNARTLVRGEGNTLYVSTRGDGRVYALTDEDGDGRPETRHVIGRDMNMPNGIAYRDGDLYVAEIDRLWRYPDIAAHLAAPQRVLIRDDLPRETHHGWRYIAFGPDGKLYLAIGAPCNICKPDSFSRDGRQLEFGSITRMNADGSDWEVYARGVRNSVGFTWQPGTDTLWFTDNGRDWLGDDRPSCELNRAPKAGLHFGYPYCHGKDIADPEFGKGRACADSVAPARELGPHVAPLGVKFYTGTQFPPAYRNQVFIAEHGSWNRSTKIGYRVTRVALDDNGAAVSYEPFATGWLQGGDRVRGRPVDLLVWPDGSLLVSDDDAGRIWRIRYTGAAAAADRH